jgi:hypothetical protein
MDDAPDYAIRPVWLQTLDWAVAQALEVGLLVILDMHEFGALARDFEGLRRYRITPDLLSHAKVLDIKSD